MFKLNANRRVFIMGEVLSAIVGWWFFFAFFSSFYFWAKKTNRSQAPIQRRIAALGYGLGWPYFTFIFIKSKLDQNAGQGKPQATRNPAFNAPAPTMPPVQPSVSTASSKAGALREWAAGVVKDAGVSLTAERVEEHANMAAGSIRFMVFLQLGAPLGISDLQQFYYPDPMPELSPIAGFEDLYSRVIARVGGAELVDQGIDEVLANARPEFVRGCRERYS
jgi:hypothetical protein